VLARHLLATHASALGGLESSFLSTFAAEQS
jgi:hypothetical protein